MFGDFVGLIADEANQVKAKQLKEAEARSKIAQEKSEKTKELDGKGE
jgi:hypothetical protein